MTVDVRDGGGTTIRLTWLEKGVLGIVATAIGAGIPAILCGLIYIAVSVAELRVDVVNVKERLVRLEEQGE